MRPGRQIGILVSLALAATLALACSSNKNNSNQNKTVGTAARAATQVAAVSATSAATKAPASPAASSVPMCPPSGAANALIGAGSTFDNPLFSKLFDVYNQQCKVQVNYQSIGSGGGIQQLTQKTVQFGATDAPLTDEQIKAAGGDVVHIPVTIGAVPVGYNLPGVKSGMKLTGDTLAKIFMGQIKKWNDPAIKVINPGANLPDLDIAVVHRSDGSGTSFIFTSYLSAVSPDWKSKVGAATSVEWPTGSGGKGSEGVAGLVKQTPGGIGYFELAYAVQNTITVATLQNQAGKFVDPTSDGASAAAAGAIANLPPDLRATFVNAPGDASYPISGFSWVAINTGQSDAKVAQSLVSLLWWVTHDGQKYAQDLSYAPLPEQLQKLDEAQLKKITADGKPVLAQ
ncbi:MAG TPA: phosphate ABC transporter substrate-binding protein PstS [Dehalococcoidia bacterium]|nr:phosphate ABC transporter substrate-binding protein PstS [Dehalococcoidia bacterium]